MYVLYMYDSKQNLYYALCMKKVCLYIYKQNKFRKEYLERTPFACECYHKYIDQKIDPNTMTITKNIN